MMRNLQLQSLTLLLGESASQSGKRHDSPKKKKSAAL
jgi:hypothetical protein